jgi:hypothetical protein
MSKKILGYLFFLNLLDLSDCDTRKRYRGKRSSLYQIQDTVLKNKLGKEMKNRNREMKKKA